jgi:hypothetical protein
MPIVFSYSRSLYLHRCLYFYYYEIENTIYTQCNLDKPNLLKQWVVRTIKSFELLDSNNKFELFGKVVYSKDLQLHSVYKQRPEPADVLPHAGLRPSGNRVTSFTAQRGRSINTIY